MCSHKALCIKSKMAKCLSHETKRSETKRNSTFEQKVYSASQFSASSLSSVYSLIVLAVDGTPGGGAAAEAWRLPSLTVSTPLVPTPLALPRFRSLAANPFSLVMRFAACLVGLVRQGRQLASAAICVVLIWDGGDRWKRGRARRRVSPAPPQGCMLLGSNPKV
jgi:hypothetical protein